MQLFDKITPEIRDPSLVPSLGNYVPSLGDINWFKSRPHKETRLRHPTQLEVETFNLPVDCTVQIIRTSNGGMTREFFEFVGELDTSMIEEHRRLFGYYDN